MRPAEENSPPLRRGSGLLDRPADVIDRLLEHTKQQEAVGVVASLIDMLRRCRTPADLVEFQGVLFKEIYECQEHAGRIARAKKRHRSHKAFDHDLLGSSGDLETEQLVYDRIGRQLRSVGDAMAWRAFRFDRRFIVALSQNEPAGPMPGKAGLNYELGRVIEIWRDRGNFALLHDLTSCLRIADITEFAADGTRIDLIEVKANPRNQRASQTTRARSVVDTLLHSAPLRSPVSAAALAVLDAPLKTVLSSARHVIDEAAHKGLASRRLPGPRVLTVLDGTSLGLPSFEPDGAEELDAVRSAAMSAAGVNDGAHRLRAHSVDVAARLPAMAPQSIFPYSPIRCARLVCDYTVMEWYMGVDALVDALSDAGLRARVTLPRADGDLLPGEPVVEAWSSESGLSINGSAVHQLLLEGIDLPSYAAAIREMLDLKLAHESAVLVFSRESRAWR